MARTRGQWFRLDEIWYLKDAQFRDNLLNPDYCPGQPPKASLIPLYTADLPEVHDAIEEMRRVVDAFGDRLLIGEIYLLLEKLVIYYGRDLRERAGLLSLSKGRRPCAAGLSGRPAVRPSK